MKKLLSIVALLAMLSLASCGGATEETTPSETTTETSTETSMETPVETPVEAPAAE
jgi:hypothetical protein